MSLFSSLLSSPPVDTYKSIKSTDACTPCSNETTTRGLTGATSDSRCLTPCPSGQVGVNGACVACAADLFESNGVCQQCPIGTSTNGQTGSTSCDFCAPGYTTSNETCVECSAGTFKTTAGNDSCTSCVAGTFSLAIGASNNTCESCGVDQYSDSGSTQCLPCANSRITRGQTGLGACLCPYGQIDAGSQCVDCLADSIENAGVCESCAVGYSTKGGVGQTVCEYCAAGYTSENGTCIGCAIGSFKTTAGNETCTECPAGKTTLAIGSTECVSNSCPAGSALSGDNGCQLCAIGTFKAEAGLAVCIPCPANTYADTIGSTQCKKCLPLTISEAGSDTCTPADPNNTGASNSGALAAGLVLGTASAAAIAVGALKVATVANATGKPALSVFGKMVQKAVQNSAAAASKMATNVSQATSNAMTQVTSKFTTTTAPPVSAV